MMLEYLFQGEMTFHLNDGREKTFGHLAEEDTVVIESLSRLGRSTKDFIELVERLHQKGVQLVSLKD